MGKFTRAELEEAYQIYDAAVKQAVASGDWRCWANIFTEDATYIEHAYGEFRGREAIYQWISKVMAPFPTMYFPQDWVVYDEENSAIVMCVQNVLPHPSDPEKSFGFPNWTRLIYAGNGLFSLEEDIYNPSKDAPAVIRAWIEAGGKFATSEQVKMEHA
ncbi:MAG: nuclear transport factor 2 family protein [Pseudomonadales bacterium]|nr:nuclear transport factor 2 family protein [Pseudomonadales bacterium]